MPVKLKQVRELTMTIQLTKPLRMRVKSDRLIEFRFACLMDNGFYLSENEPSRGGYWNPDSSMSPSQLRRAKIAISESRS